MLPSRFLSSALIAKSGRLRDGAADFADESECLIFKIIAELDSKEVVRAALHYMFHVGAAEERSALRSKGEPRAHRD
jgi:hypothetical protein